VKLGLDLPSAAERELAVRRTAAYPGIGRSWVRWRVRTTRASVSGIVHSDRGAVIMRIGVITLGPSTSR
jgi:hypothetical protein